MNGDQAQQLAVARAGLQKAVERVKDLDQLVRALSHYPIDQYYSPATKETLSIVSDEDPPVDLQREWVAAHPDAVRLKNCFEKRCPCCGQQMPMA